MNQPTFVCRDCGWISDCERDFEFNCHDQKAECYCVECYAFMLEAYREEQYEEKEFDHD